MVEEVIQEVFVDENMGNGSDMAKEEKTDCEKDVKERLAEWLTKFKCGKDYNEALFVKTAKDILLPLVSFCQIKESETQVALLSQILFSSTVNAAVIFRSESQLWIKRIHRRFARKKLPEGHTIVKFT